MAQMTSFDPNLVREVNRLWLPVYSGLAEQAASYCAQAPQNILEIGCFSGGMGLTLLQRYPDSRLAVALELDELAATFSRDWEGLLSESDSDRVSVVASPLTPLRITGNSHDLVICRGVFFFLDPGGAVLSEIDRVLSEGGVAFFGGGFGSFTSPKVIEQIADESRRINAALGKQFLSSQDFHRILDSCGLADRSRIIEEGGLWALLEK
ncbi:MAG: class I SAM-dependent methyltransferase [Deltaproteobacteria bacterium]